MKLNPTKELAALERMTVGQLHQRYIEVFGEPVRSRHKRHLIRRIAWRLQANAEGGLSERALRRAEELADVADARVTPPKSATPTRPTLVAASSKRSDLPRMTQDRDAIHERMLRPLAAEISWRKQRGEWRRLKTRRAEASDR